MSIHTVPNGGGEPVPIDRCSVRAMGGLFVLLVIAVTLSVPS